ncbi:MAG TPA: hypothetical protein VFV08_08260, partial [Puia sp.]|nr:hypothetical protein [Puia sp.]
WEIDSPDPCKKDEKICFIPGADPYSFVATVVLPAWPARFRKFENRKLLENILYRETPAHVLLRILWLTPHDLCCFETYYKNWIRWLAQKRICANDFTICQLIDFLFYRQLNCFECEECIPCSAATNVDPCQFATGTIEDPNKYLNQLNDVFCWTEIDCSQAPEFIPCGDPAQRLHRASTSTPQLEIETAKPKSEAVKNKASIGIAEKPSINLGEEESGIELDDERKIDRRFTSYRQEAEEIYHDSKRNKNAERVNGFLHEQAPKLAELSESLEAILKNEKPKSKNKSSLTHSQQASLIKLSIWYYLDTRILYGKQIENTTKFEALLKEISGKHFLPVFKDWKEKDIQIL